jgi:hypothetical protein
LARRGRKGKRDTASAWPVYNKNNNNNYTVLILESVAKNLFNFI